MVVTSNFSFPVGFSWDFSSLSSTSFFSRLRRGEVTSARFGMNFPKCVIMPKNCSIFAWSTFIRSDDIIRPRNTIGFTPIWHLFLFSFSQLLRIFKTLYLSTHYVRQEFKVQISPKFHICKFFLWVVNVRLFSIQELSRSASTTIDETFDRDNIIMNTSVYFIGYWSTVRGWSNTPIGGFTFDQRNFNQIFNVPLKI